MWLSLLLALAVCAMAPKADARAQAPGAPGDPHTWAPADKHGFGTATELASNVWFTLRDAELSEAYYPDLGTPSCAGSSSPSPTGAPSSIARPAPRR